MMDEQKKVAITREPTSFRYLCGECGKPFLNPIVKNCPFCDALFDNKGTKCSCPQLQRLQFDNEKLRNQ